MLSGTNETVKDDNGNNLVRAVYKVQSLNSQLLPFNDPKLRSEILRYLFELLIAARQASIYVSPFGAKHSCWNSATICRNSSL